MKKLAITILFAFLIVSLSFSQSKNIGSSLVREEIELLDKQKSTYRYSYSEKDWYKKYDTTSANEQKDYELISMKIDTTLVYSIVREVMTASRFNINKEKWIIKTKLSSDGDIVAVSFLFKDETGLNIQKLAILAKRIREEAKWKLYFNKKVDHLFYLNLSFPGPRL